jgi:pyrroline-5-carboxylate reductase
MILTERISPAALKDAVCSPKGTTIKGVYALEKDGFRGSVMDAISAVESAKVQK